MKRGCLISLAAAVSSACVLVGLGVSGAVASTRGGGSVKFWATPTEGGARSLVITGAIGDYGSSLNVNASGAADPKGGFAEIKLHRGTFRLDIAALNAAADKASFPIDKASCSSEGSVTRAAGISGGTAQYAGISGKLSITLTFVWIVARSSSGKCVGSKVLYQSGYITGHGTVSFS